jgi:hypothetical protein
VSPPAYPAAIACVVEGDGEVRALPRLLHRVASELGVLALRTPTPMRVNRARLIASGGIERAVAAMASRGGTARAVLVVLDADDDCPAQLGPELLKRARQARSDARVVVVLPTREFEAWFLAAASSLGGHQGFPATLDCPADPEAIRGAKEWLTRARKDGHRYRPTVDQAPLASAFDLSLARSSSPSFDKFCRDIAWLLDTSPDAR